MCVIKDHARISFGKMSGLKISIMVPVWNEEARLPLCIAHLLDYAQREENMASEIIICADGSTDGR